MISGEDEYLWLDIPIHKNKFNKIDVTEIDTLKLSFDGAIMAVKKGLVEGYYASNDVQMIKAGYTKMPEKMTVETEDDLYNYLSYFISL